MSDGFTNGFAIGGLAAVVAMTVLCAITTYWETEAWRADAIKHHAAHYELDPATGASTFHWNDEGSK